MKQALFLLPFLFSVSANTTPDNKEYVKPRHVIIVIEENHSFDQIIGSAYAPYINSLAEQGALFTDAHGIAHPSQPNYIAIFSGSTQGISDDKCLKSTFFNTPNLGTSLQKEGYSFAGFAQTMPSDGFTGCYYKLSNLTKAYLYGRKHCPWVHWQGKGTNQLSPSLSHTMAEFPEDFSKLPTVSFVIPDMDHDMHNIGKDGDDSAIYRGDQWLKDNLSKYVEWAQTHQSLLIITFDEDNFQKQNHIPTIFVGPMVKPGRYTQRINHYSVLRTIESMYHLPKLGDSEEKAIDGIWR